MDAVAIAVLEEFLSLHRIQNKLLQQRGCLWRPAKNMTSEIPIEIMLLVHKFLAPNSNPAGRELAIIILGYCAGPEGVLLLGDLVKKEQDKQCFYDLIWALQNIGGAQAALELCNIAKQEKQDSDRWFRTISALVDLAEGGYCGYDLTLLRETAQPDPDSPMDLLILRDRMNELLWMGNPRFGLPQALDVLEDMLADPFTCASVAKNAFALIRVHAPKPPLET